jgi:D-alanyl-lipoteichoic acid acyltransferase DltB (MBOAT superfamily)
MLFNSFVFLLGFLPLALLLHWSVERWYPQGRLVLLLALSFIFYGYWDWRFIPLLAFSIVMNWVVAQLFLATRKSLVITLAIILNIAVLAFFKYTNFLIDMLAFFPNWTLPKAEIALPLGISFFTFHHVMYLVDLRRGEAPRYDLVRYGLYIAFFPQVLAGPLVRWREIMHQFETRPYARTDSDERIARGIMLLVVGLAKKVFVGDALADYVNPIFEAAASGKAVTVLEAWQATLGFTFQIYFDFSGYTDMALGLALLFGIMLPQNFNVPYRAVSLQDFWRRWHMTLSRFLRDYLYIPLGGNRYGVSVQVWALFATMALGGLWHGAGLTYIAWGVAHGMGLGVCVFCNKLKLPMPTILGWALTFLFVALTWVLFRASSFDAAMLMYQSLFGFAEWGTVFKWKAIAIAAAVAMIGLSAWDFVTKVPPTRLAAVAFAFVFVLVIFKIGDEANYEFIYFQF